MNRDNLQVVYVLLNDLEKHINNAASDIEIVQNTIENNFANYELKYIERKLDEVKDAIKDLRKGYEKLYSSPANKK